MYAIGRMMANINTNKWFHTYPKQLPNISGKIINPKNENKIPNIFAFFIISIPLYREVLVIKKKVK
jgi:hypothetical protein